MFPPKMFVLLTNAWRQHLYRKLWSSTQADTSRRRGTSDESTISSEEIPAARLRIQYLDF